MNGHIPLYLPTQAGAPSALREFHAYDRFTDELGKAGCAITIEETKLRDIAPEGVALVHCVGAMEPLVSIGKERFHRTVFLAARPSDTDALLNAFLPAGIAEISTLALWRQGRPMDKGYSGVFLREDYFGAQPLATPKHGTPYAMANGGETLVACLAAYLDWLKRGVR